MPLARQRRQVDRIRDREAPLASPVGLLDVLEDRAVGEPREGDLDARVPEQVELVGLRGLDVGTDQGAHRKAQPGERQRGVADRAAEPPAARIRAGHVARRGADDEDPGRRRGS